MRWLVWTTSNWFSIQVPEVRRRSVCTVQWSVPQPVVHALHPHSKQSPHPETGALLLPPDLQTSPELLLPLWQPDLRAVHSLSRSRRQHYISLLLEIGQSHTRGMIFKPVSLIVVPSKYQQSVQDERFNISVLPLYLFFYFSCNKGRVP